MGLENSDDSFGSCPCGSAWFSLKSMEEGGDTKPAVCISEDGEIDGYAGKLVCIECDLDWQPNARFEPPQRHLRLVT